jgi:hypothetical protein
MANNPNSKLMKIKTALLLFSVALRCAAPPLGTPEVVTLAQFTFQASQPSASAAANTWYTNLTAEAGTGTASALHQGATIYSDPTGNGSSRSFCANNWNVGDCWQFTCSTLNASAINVACDLVGSGTGAANFQLEYSTDGTRFTNFGSPMTVARNGALSGPTTYWSTEDYNSTTHYTTNLSSIAALNNAANAWFRLVVSSDNAINGGTIGTNGTDRVDNFTISGTIIVPNGTAVVTWPAPAPIVYGTALGTNQLNAAAAVAGAFTYSPPAGTILNAGANTLTAVFTPTNNSYSKSTNTINLVVSPAPLNVTAANAARTTGQTNPAFAGSIFGLVNNDFITASYSCGATTNSAASNYAIVPALLDPNGRMPNYTVSTNAGTLTVSAGVIEEIVLAGWNFTASKPAVSNSGGIWISNILPELGNGNASALHHFYTAYTSPVGNGGSNSFSANKWATNDFFQFACSTVNASNISVAFDQITSLTGPGRFQFQYSLNGSTFINVSAPYTVYANTLLYGPTNFWNKYTYNPTTHYLLNLSSIPSLNNAATVWFRITDVSTASADGSSVGNDGTVRVYGFTAYGAAPLAPGTPVLSWTPTPITYGTPLGSGQLNATASTYGTFSYTPPAGTVLAGGTQTLSVVFTPYDTTNYSNASANVPLVVTYASNTVLINPVLLSPGVFQFSISNISASTSYSVLSTTNLLQPLTNWTLIGTASNISPGIYQFTATNATNTPHYYSVRSP